MCLSDRGRDEEICLIIGHRWSEEQDGYVCDECGLFSATEDWETNGATSSEAQGSAELRTNPCTKEMIMPDVRTIGPFVDTYRLVVDGSRVPYTEIRPSNPKLTEWHITVDGRFGIDVDSERLTEFGWFLANAMAVAAGWTCHGDAAERINPHNRVVHELSADNVDFDDEPGAGAEGG